MHDGCKVHMDLYMTSNGSCFMVTFQVGQHDAKCVIIGEGSAMGGPSADTVVDTNNRSLADCRRQQHGGHSDPRVTNTLQILRSNRTPAYRNERNKHPPTDTRCCTDRHQLTTTYLHQEEGHDEEPTQDKKPQPDPSKEGRRRKPQQTINIRVSSLFIQWVLISTITMCTSAHLTALSIPLHTLHSQSYIPPKLPPEVYPPSSSLSTPTSTNHNPPRPHLSLQHCSTSLLHNVNPHTDPLPQAESSPAPTPPTQHHHTTVSIKTCTYQQSTTYSNTTQKSHSTILINLPPKRRRRPLTPHAIARSLPPYQHPTTTYIPHPPHRCISPAQTSRRTHHTALKIPLPHIQIQHTPTSSPHSLTPKTDNPNPSPNHPIP